MNGLFKNKRKVGANVQAFLGPWKKKTDVILENKKVILYISALQSLVDSLGGSSHDLDTWLITTVRMVNNHG